VRVSARVFNLAGELVRTVGDDQMPAGVVVWEWDGRTDGGDFVGNGTYFIQIVSGKDVQIKRAIVLKF
jgi:flagellar hook assembly protein FlgD